MAFWPVMYVCTQVKINKTMGYDFTFTVGKTVKCRKCEVKCGTGKVKVLLQASKVPYGGELDRHYLRSHPIHPEET